ncbi:response regulator [Mesorhizobium sp. WSM4935]|uniref:response regulator n=1 Tax=Mesorhizobium sp. WSM4935 TaxID=3038547 RepID=UPI00241527E5|nr:response regulator [Mesorhizobium sp. WSM4935]MDG4874117.1 response regulator [Mesorhizobium sp. WSM4935]
MQKTVLIVEDEFLIAMDLKAMLERRDWRVMGPVPSVAAALKLLEIEVPSVALLDVNLGDELVTPVAEKLRSLQVPFAVASAYDRADLFGGAVLAGAPNVGKPTQEARLVTALVGLLESPES